MATLHTQNEPNVQNKDNIVIFMNCHGYEILKYMRMNKELLQKYNVTFITINYYVGEGQKYFELKSLADCDSDAIKKADVLILQVIENDRGFLNNDEVIKYCKNSAKIIKIPHYRNSVYEYKIIGGLENKSFLAKNWYILDKIKDLKNTQGTINIIKSEIEIMNNFDYGKENMNTSLEQKINEFEKIDGLSDIKMIDFYINNYKKHRLFKGRGYPSSIFFYELTNRILINLNMSINDKFVDLFFAENTSEPIPKYWHKFCNFEFINEYYTCGHIPIKEYEWYYIILLSKNVNILDKNKNLELLEFIRK